MLGHLVGSSHGGSLCECLKGGGCWSSVWDALGEMIVLHTVVNVILKLSFPKAGHLFAYMQLKTPVNGNSLFYYSWHLLHSFQDACLFTSALVSQIAYTRFVHICMYSCVCRHVWMLIRLRPSLLLAFATWGLEHRSQLHCVM